MKNSYLTLSILLLTSTLANGMISTCPSTSENFSKLSQQDKDAQLLEAAKSGSVKTLIHLLHKGCNIEALDDNKDTPLHWAAYEGNAECLQILLDHNANIEALDNLKMTPLNCAAAHGSTECLKILLDHNANIEAVDTKGGTPLHYAAANDNPECLQILLDHNANIEAVDKEGGTPLHWASYHGNTECLQILLDHKANIEALDKEGGTPLHWAAENDSTKCLQILLEHKANNEGYNNTHETVLIELSDAQITVPKSNISMSSILTFIPKNGPIPCKEISLETWNYIFSHAKTSYALVTLEKLLLVPNFSLGPGTLHWQQGLLDEILQKYKELTLDQIRHIINAINYLEIPVLLPIAQKAYGSKQAQILLGTIQQQFTHDLRGGIIQQIKDTLNS